MTGAHHKVNEKLLNEYFLGKIEALIGEIYGKVPDYSRGRKINFRYSNRMGSSYMSGK
jgi:hypothetical protein